MSLNREMRRIVGSLRTPGEPAEQLLQVMTCRFADGREIAERTRCVEDHATCSIVATTEGNRMSYSASNEGMLPQMPWNDDATNTPT